MSSPTRINDLIILGRSAPEPIHDGRHTVCLGGYSESHGYVRLYPTQERMDALKRWNVVSVPVEQSTDDTRDESYKIAGSKEDWDSLHQKIEQVDRLSKADQIELVDELAGDCPIRLNENRESLGMVRPITVDDVYLEPNDEPTHQVDLNMQPRKGKNDYPHTLYVRYRCDNCDAKGYHDQHCIEWGVYRYWDKYNDPEGVKDALGFGEDNTQHYFFVGNLNHERRAYIIISVIRFQEEDMLNSGVSVPNQTSLTEW